MPDVGRPKNNDYPAYMLPDGDRGGFIVRNPLNGKRKRFSIEQEQQARDTALALAQLVEARRQNTLLNAGRPSVAMLVDRWTKERLPLMPWDASTRKTAEWRVARIRKEMGARFVEDLDCLFFETWLSQTAVKADPFNKWRYILLLLWRFAVAQKWAAANEAEKVEQRSTSRKIEANRKTRQQLDAEGYTAIYEQAPAWLQLAMDMSLVTLQARREVCGIQHSDFRAGFIYVIRDKVAGDSNMAFIKIRVTAELEALQSRARKVDDVASPYLIHRRPARLQRRWMKGKPHWTYVNGRYLTQAFAEARDKVDRFKVLPERERPSFHEIRGLGGRLSKAKGVAKKDIQSLMTHSSPRTTEIYLELGPAALTDEHFIAVSAPFSVRELLGAPG
jgi:integrase